MGNYARYLKSETWIRIREKAIEEFGACCEVCKSENGIEIHHKAYPEVLGTEPTSYLMVLCHRCHSTYHKIYKGLRVIEDKDGEEDFDGRDYLDIQEERGSI